MDKRLPGRVSLDSGEISDCPETLKSFEKKRDVFQNTEDNQNTSTVWKNIGKLFYKTKSKQKRLGTINVVRDKDFSLQRLSSFFRTKKLSQNTLVPLTTVGESATGYQAVFTEKHRKSSNANVTAMAIKLPNGITADDVVVTVELSMIRTNAANSELPTLQEPMTMYCTEDSPSQTVFTGVLKVPNETEMTNLLKMPLYLIDSLENVVLNPGSEISHKTIVRTSKEISRGNPFIDEDGDDVQVKLTFNKTSSSSNKQQDIETDNNDSDERLIMVNSYNASEISSILKGKYSDSDETSSDKTSTKSIVDMPKTLLESKEKTEDAPKITRTMGDKTILSRKKVDCVEKDSENKNKTSTRIFEHPEPNEFPKRDNLNDVSTQYSNSYFTATKEIDVQNSLYKKTKPSLTVPDNASLSTTTSVEINDFTYFGDKLIHDSMLPKHSLSTDETQWPSSSTLTVAAETSVTLLSFASEYAFNNTKPYLKPSSNAPSINLDNDDMLIKTETNLPNTPSGTTIDEAPKISDNLPVTIPGIDIETPREESLLISLHSEADVSEEERELIRKEDHNKRYYEDNDEYYEKHRGDVQDFFRDHNLSFDHFQISKSQKNYDLYLGGDQNSRFFNSQYVDIKDSERVIAIHDNLDTVNEEELPGTVSTVQSIEITANFIYENILSKIPTSTANCENSAYKKIAEETIIEQCDKKSPCCSGSSSSIIFKVAGGMQLKTEDSYISSSSKKTIMLAESTVDINDTGLKESLKVVEAPLQKHQKKNKILSISDHAAKAIASDAPTSKINESLTDLDKNNRLYLNGNKVATKISQSNSAAPKAPPQKHVLNKLKNNSEERVSNRSFDQKDIYQNDLNIDQNIDNNVNIKDLKSTNIENNFALEKYELTEKQSNAQTLEGFTNPQKCNLVFYSQLSKSPSQLKTALGTVNTQKPASKSLNILNKYSIHLGKKISNETHFVPTESKVNDLKDCLIKMNEILITATSMSLLNNSSSNITKTVDKEYNNTNNLNLSTHNDLELSQEKQKTYEAVENDIKNVIEELLKESKDIKESVILERGIEESEPAFTVDYAKQEPIDYTELCLVMMDKIEKHKQKNKTIEMKLQKESKQEIMCVIDSIIDNVVTVSNRKIYLNDQQNISNVIQSSDQKHKNLTKKRNKSPNSFEKKQNTINTQMTHFCNSEIINAKIPKTCYSFGKIFDTTNNNYDGLCCLNNEQLQEHEFYSNNESANSFNNNFSSTDFKSDHSFAEDHNLQISICGSDVDSTVVLPSLTSNDDNRNQFMKITNNNIPSGIEKTKESCHETVWNHHTNHHKHFDKPKGVPRSKKQYQLTKFSDTKINMPSTSSQYINHDSSDEEVVLKDIDLTNAKEFSTDEEILLASKKQESFYKDELFTTSSSDENINLKQDFIADHAQVSLQSKTSLQNLHSNLHLKPSDSHKGTLNLNILNAKHSSETSEADDENDNIKIIINIPKHRYKSKLELNTPQELEDIEKNLKDNEVFTKTNALVAKNSSISTNSSCSFKQTKKKSTATFSTTSDSSLESVKQDSKTPKVL